MAQAGVQQGILAAKDLELHVPGAADELGSLGDVAAGILHAHDVGHGVCQFFHQLCAEGVAHPSGIIIQQNRRFGNTFCNGLKVIIQLGVGGLQEHGLQHADCGGTVCHCHPC